MGNHAGVDFYSIVNTFFVPLFLSIPILIPCKQFASCSESNTFEVTDVNTKNANNRNIDNSKFRKYFKKRELSKFNSFCENNGTFINGRCECRFPFTGSRCRDYSCEHGLSVGPRYDPGSLYFNRKCICDDDWAGEYCNIPIAEQCNDRGQYHNGHCKCHGYYFGPKCQYVGKCVNGKLQEGKCICVYGYEGDYCDRIVCHHGYADKNNHSESCICPPRHAGIFCDECILTGPHILPYPNCTEEKIPHWARISREKTDWRILSRMLILGGMIFLLGVFVSVMLVLRWDLLRNEHQEEMWKRAIWQSTSRHQSRVSLKYSMLQRNDLTGAMAKLGNAE